MDEEEGAFAVQDSVRQPWRTFIDSVAPLRPDLFRYCCGLTGNVWDGEDLAQDTLLRVFGALGKNAAALRHPRAYLIRAATNLWIDRVRKTGLERTHADLVAAEGIAPGDPSQVMRVREAAAVLFLHLAPQERAAVLLKDVLDFTLEETAAMLKTSIGAVKSALHRGRERLKTARASPPADHAVPRAVVDRFVAALAGKQFDAIRAMCQSDITIDMVGGANFDGYESAKVAIEHAHVVAPAQGFGEKPHWQAVQHHGEWIAIGFRTLDGQEGINEIWRFELGEDGRISRLRLYCFNPDVLAAVGKDLGFEALARPYRSPI